MYSIELSAWSGERSFAGIASSAQKFLGSRRKKNKKEEKEEKGNAAMHHSDSFLTTVLMLCGLAGVEWHLSPEADALLYHRELDDPLRYICRCYSRSILALSSRSLPLSFLLFSYPPQHARIHSLSCESIPLFLISLSSSSWEILLDGRRLSFHSKSCPVI